MHKFFHFAPLKPTFSILHIYFYKTPTSACLLYTFIQIKYSFLYPHNHRPTPTIHTGITSESTQPIGKKPEKQTKQNGSKPTYQDWHLALSNKTDAFGGDGENEKQDRLLQRQAVAMARTRNKIDSLHQCLWWRWWEQETRLTPPKASGGNGDGERHSTPFNPKPTDQAHSTWKQREPKE